MTKLHPNEYGKRFQDARIGIAGTQHTLLDNWDTLLDDIKYINRFTKNIHLLLTDVRGKKGLRQITSSLPDNVGLHTDFTEGVQEQNLWMKALAHAQRLRLRKLFILQHKAVEDLNGNLIQYVNHENAETVLQGLPEALRNRIHALLGKPNAKEPLKRIHILGSQKHAVKNEMFSLDGVGTMIMRDPEEYKHEFSMADKNDVGSIHELIEPYVKQGYIKKRNQEDIEKNIGNFCKITVDDIIAGCTEIMEIEEEKEMVEMGAVAVVDRFKNNQISKSLIVHFMDEVGRRGTKGIFVSTKNEKLSQILEGFGFLSMDPTNPLTEGLKKRTAKSPGNKFYIFIF